MTSNFNKSLVFYRVFFARLKRRYLQCFRTLHKTLRKHWHFQAKERTFVQKSSVFSCFLHADYVSVFNVLPEPTFFNEKTLTFLSNIVVCFVIQCNLQCFVSLDGRCKRMHFYVGIRKKNETHTKTLQFMRILQTKTNIFRILHHFTLFY